MDLQQQPQQQQQQQPAAEVDSRDAEPVSDPIHRECGGGGGGGGSSGMMMDTTEDGAGAATTTPSSSASLQTSLLLDDPRSRSGSAFADSLRVKFANLIDNDNNGGNNDNSPEDDDDDDEESTVATTNNSSGNNFERQQQQQQQQRQSPQPRLTLSAFRREAVRLTHADPRRKLSEEYDLHAPGCRVLGHGAFSTVRLAERKRDGTLVAVKSVAKHDALRSRRLRFITQQEGQQGGSSRQKQQQHHHHHHHHSISSYLEEWEILRKMRAHPYVITLYDLYETDDEIQIVTEYCSGGELFDAIQKKRSSSSHPHHHHRCAHSMRRGQYSEAQAASITGQILTALADLHGHDIVHRDVKPENILIVRSCRSSNSSNNDTTPTAAASTKPGCCARPEDTLHVKLCDFGVARQTDHPINSSSSSSSIVINVSDNASAVVSSDGESSPLTPGRSRQYSAIGSDYYVAPEVVFGSGTYDTAIDIYSLGVTLYILLCGFPPVFSEPTTRNNTIAGGRGGGRGEEYFDDDDDTEVVFPNSYWKHISEDAKNLVRKMLARDPTVRVRAREALGDPWIARHFKSTIPSSTTTKTGILGSMDRQPNLDVVRNKLCQALAASQRKEVSSTTPSISSSAPSKKKRPVPPFADVGSAPSYTRATTTTATSSPPPRRASFMGISSTATMPARKRARMERRASSCLMALADLYRGVAASPSAKVIAAGADQRTMDLKQKRLDFAGEVGDEKRKPSLQAAFSF